MAKMGGRRHVKKLAAPKPWPILRKDYTWTTKAKPGKHSLTRGMALITIVKELMNYANTRKEAMMIIKAKEIFVDGKAVREPKFSVGFMDIVSVPKVKKNYRVTFTKKGEISLQEIPVAESGFKLCRIESKTILKKKKVQLNLHDGRNQVVKKDTYNVGDTVKLELPKQKIVDHFELKKGHNVYVMAGKHAGEIDKVKEIIKGTIVRKPVVVLENGVRTLKDYVFVIGKEKPAITVSSQ